MFSVIKYRKITLGVSLALVILAIVSIAIFGFRQGIDLSGGTLWQVSFMDRVESEVIREALLNTGLEGVAVTKSGDGSWLLRFKDVSEEQHRVLSQMLRTEVGEFNELSWQSIGPSIGQELRRKAIWGVALVLLGISIFVAIVFRGVSGEVSTLTYGVVTLITLFHDALIPTGLFSYLGYIKGVEFDTNFIVALLVIAGFSVHDTIVVFDRIRENLKKNTKKGNFEEVIEASVKETLGRSINTSMTLVFVLLALLLAGPGPLFYFGLTILVGTIVGTYSSICVASPLLVVWQKWRNE